MTTATREIAQPRITPLFSDLRPYETWTPAFHAQPDLATCADGINRPHEDYPSRVERTRLAILEVIRLQPAGLTTDLALRVHALVFADAAHAGRFRQVPVRIGDFMPPRPALLPRLMDNLEQAYQGRELDTDALASWYTDFQTIHPFQDGNGRAGGIIVAALNRRNDAGYWLTPGQ